MDNTLTLQEYLNRFFPQPSVEAVQKHFEEKYGVKINTSSGGLYQFKYDQIEGKFGLPLTHQCRGTILRYAPEGWVYCARSWDKFWNLHEGYCPLHDPKVFEAELPGLCFSEKVDGTCILVWFDTVQGIWRVSTLGAIDTKNVGDYPITFEQLFLRELNRDFSEFCQLLDTEMSYMFELACPENRILTQYSGTRLVLVGARHTAIGYYPAEYDMDRACTVMTSYGFPIERPRYWYASAEGLDSQVAVLSWLDKQGQNTELGMYPEGFVLYRSGNCQPVAKMKHESYLMLLAFSGGQNIRHSRKKIAEAVVLGKLDDVLPLLSDSQKVFAEHVKQEYLGLVQAALAGASLLSGTVYPTRKDYALAVQAIIPCELHGFFYQNQSLVAEKPAEVPEAMRLWLRTGYERFVDSWLDFK